MYFDTATFGTWALTGNPLADEMSKEEITAAVTGMPISPADQDAFIRLLVGGADYLQARPLEEKDHLLRHTSYLDYLESYAGIPSSVREILRDSWLPLVGVGWEPVVPGFPCGCCLPTNSHQW